MAAQPHTAPLDRDLRQALKAAVDACVRATAPSPPEPWHGTGARAAKWCDCQLCRDYRAQMKRRWRARTGRD